MSYILGAKYPNKLEQKIKMVCFIYVGEIALILFFFPILLKNI